MAALFRDAATERRLRRGQGGFSLIEIMVVMVLLTVIILGLLATFNQTQRAFKTGMAQVDVLETGRAVMDLMVRDLQTMTALPPTPNTNTVNFAAFTLFPELTQELPGTSTERTNVLQAFFFVSRMNQTWTGNGYIVADGASGVGSLYTYTTNVSERRLPEFLIRPSSGLYELFDSEYSRFLNGEVTRFRRVAEGVIHLQIHAYGTNGLLLDPYYDAGFYTNIVVEPDPNVPDSTVYLFYSNALPSAVEVELGMVDPDVVERVRSLPSVPNETVRREYLYRQAGKVHLFRQRVPVREMEPEAYQ